LQLGAKMADFAGWEMPIQYNGIIAEHKAVRERVGIFDVSHMGQIFITGPDTLERCAPIAFMRPWIHLKRSK